MSLHGNPQCAASAFALHLEQTYGLQLDPYRHRQLVVELEEYAGRVDELPSGAYMMPPAEPPKTGFFKYYPCRCKAGPGPRNMPDYCSEHGSADKTDGCVTTFGEPAESAESYEASEALQAVPQFGVPFEFTPATADALVRMCEAIDRMKTEGTDAA